MTTTYYSTTQLAHIIGVPYHKAHYLATKYCEPVKYVGERALYDSTAIDTMRLVITTRKQWTRQPQKV